MALESKDISVIGVFTTDADLVVRVWDDALASMTGIPSAAVVGKHLTDVVPDVEGRGLLSRFEFVRDFGASEVLSAAFHRFLIPCPPRCRSRFSEMRQAVTISPLRSGNKIEGLIAVIEDVTERMDHERDLAEKLRDPDDGVRLTAAKELSNGADPLHPPEAEAIINALSDKNWRVRRSIVDGLTKRAAPDAVAALLEAVREEHLDFGLLNGALQVLEATSVDTTQTLLQFLRRSDDHDLRMQAALALGHQRNSEAVQPLLEALNDPDPNVRYHIIEALGSLRAPAAVEPLMAVAESRDFFLSFAALDALKEIGDPSIADRVSRLMSDDLLREAAAGTLGATGDTRAAAQLTELLNAGKLPATIACASLCSLFERHAVPGTEENSVAFTVRETINSSGTSALIAALDASDAHARGGCTKVAGWITEKDILAKLSSLLDEAPLSETLLEALVQQGEKAVPILIEKLENEDAEVRSAAARALGSIGGDAAIDALIGALRSDTSIAPAALEAFAASPSSNAIDALIGLLNSSDQVLRRGAVNILRRVSRPDISERLYRRLDDADANVREAAIRVIGGWQTPEGQAAVMAACNDRNEEVRTAAVEQLASLATDEGVKLLTGSLDDESPRVRAAAAQALAAYAGAESEQALHKAVQDPDAWVRYFAIRSITANGNTNASAAVLRHLAMEDPAEHVRVAAGEAIGDKQG